MTTSGMPRRERQRAAGRVVDGAGRAAPLGPPAGAEGRAAQQERIDRERAGAQQPRRRQQPPADDLEAGQRGVGSSRSEREQERERLAVERLGVERGEQRSR